jgi:hypothetical protein
MKLKQILLFTSLFSSLLCVGGRNSVAIVITDGPKTNSEGETISDEAYYAAICNMFTQPTSIHKMIKENLFPTHKLRQDYYFCQNQTREEFLFKHVAVSCLIYFGEDSYLIISAWEEGFEFLGYATRLEGGFMCSRLFTGTVPKLHSWFDHFHKDRIRQMKQITDDDILGLLKLDDEVVYMLLYQDITKTNEKIKAKNYSEAETHIMGIFSKLLSLFKKVFDRIESSRAITIVDKPTLTTKYENMKKEYIMKHKHLFNYLHENLVIIYLMKGKGTGTKKGKGEKMHSTLTA